MADSQDTNMVFVCGEMIATVLNQFELNFTASNWILKIFVCSKNADREYFLIYWSCRCVLSKLCVINYWINLLTNNRISVLCQQFDTELIVISVKMSETEIIIYFVWFISNTMRIVAFYITSKWEEAKLLNYEVLINQLMLRRVMKYRWCIAQNGRVAWCAWQISIELSGLSK